MSDEQQSNENKENAGDGDFAPGASAETSTEESGLVNEVLNFATGKVNRADQASARKQVAQFRKRHPRASQDELAQMLIKEKCIKTGSVGAATSGASIIPGLGTLTSMTVGVAADITLTYALQAELVLEIAEVYGYEMSDAERRNAILLVTGISAGANRALARAGTEVAEQVGTRIASKSLGQGDSRFWRGGQHGDQRRRHLRRGQAGAGLLPRGAGGGGELERQPARAFRRG